MDMCDIRDGWCRFRARGRRLVCLRTGGQKRSFFFGVAAVGLGWVVVGGGVRGEE